MVWAISQPLRSVHPSQWYVGQPTNFSPTATKKQKCIFFVFFKIGSLWLAGGSLLQPATINEFAHTLCESKSHSNASSINPEALWQCSNFVPISQLLASTAACFLLLPVRKPYSTLAHKGGKTLLCTVPIPSQSAQRTQPKQHVIKGDNQDKVSKREEKCLILLVDLNMRASFILEIVKKQRFFVAF